MCSRIMPAARIVVFCGKGNNGGDGFVAARLLHEREKKVEVILSGGPSRSAGRRRSHVSASYRSAATAVHSIDGLKSERVQLLIQADLYLDAILGTGFKPPVSGLYAEAIAIMNASRGSGNRRGYSFWRGCRRDGPADWNDCTRRCDRDIYRAASRTCIWIADVRADVSWLESDLRKRLSSLHCN